MALRWLPDPERYAHPRLAWLFAMAFHLVLGRAFRIEHDLPEGFELAPSSVVMSNHLREPDGLLLGMVLQGRKRWHLPRPLPFFVIREDLTQPEGLANFVPIRARPVARLLAAIPIGWVPRNLRSFALFRVRECNWHDVLRDLVAAGLGDGDPAHLFNARGRALLTRRLGRLPARVASIDPWKLGPLRTAPWAVRGLHCATFRQLAPRWRARAERQLGLFAARLDDGHSVYLAPEGALSRDGRLGRLRAGTWRLGGMAKAAPAIQLFTLSYDALASGRVRVLVHFAGALGDVDYARAPDLVAKLRAALRAERMVTPSHLLAHFLVQRADPFETRTLVAWMSEALAVARRTGRSIDPLFERASIETIVTQRLRWLRRKRLLRRAPGQGWRAGAPAAAPSWRNPAGRVRYLANALADFAPACARLPVD